MKRITINDIVTDAPVGQILSVCGWVRSFRSKRFIQLNDGSCLHSLQAVVDFEQIDTDTLQQITVGAAVKVTGLLVESKGAGQDVELQVKTVEIIGLANPSDIQKTVLQPKRHSFEFLREQAHLRFRTNTFGAVFRIRHGVSFAIHKFFHENGFFHVHTPIITGTDAEGAGEMFRVTNLDLERLPKNETGAVDFNQDFFGKPVNLTVSGQLEAELAALGLGRVYTFGPTFRAENSNTSRHLAEFWMVEPEMAFYDLADNMSLAEKFLKYVCNYILTHYADDLQFLHQREQDEEQKKPQNERKKLSLTERIKFVVEQEFKRLTYTEAIDVLLRSNHYKKKKFRYEVAWGVDLQSEHERYLVEKEFERPVIIIDYPASFKAFYMRANDGCLPERQTVAAMDILFPGIGEIIGGSQREERLGILQKKCADFGIDEKDLWWYIDTRKFGSVPHAGFGLGFERMVMFLTGMTNIRDVIPFPRTPGNAEF